MIVWVIVDALGVDDAVRLADASRLLSAEFRAGRARLGRLQPVDVEATTPVCMATLLTQCPACRHGLWSRSLHPEPFGVALQAPLMWQSPPFEGTRVGAAQLPWPAAPAAGLAVAARSWPSANAPGYGWNVELPRRPWSQAQLDPATRARLRAAGRQRELLTRCRQISADCLEIALLVGTAAPLDLLITYDPSLDVLSHNAIGPLTAQAALRGELLASIGAALDKFLERVNPDGVVICGDHGVDHAERLINVTALTRRVSRAVGQPAEPWIRAPWFVGRPPHDAEVLTALRAEAAAHGIQVAAPDNAAYPYRLVAGAGTKLVAREDDWTEAAGDGRGFHQVASLATIPGYIACGVQLGPDEPMTDLASGLGSRGA